MTTHLLKTPDERKQPSRAASMKDSTAFSKQQVKHPGQHKTTRADGKRTTKHSGAKWAVTELLDVSDFDALVPRPAHRFPFTLDGFQKQAVARLEVSRGQRLTRSIPFNKATLLYIYLDSTLVWYRGCRASTGTA